MPVRMRLAALPVLLALAAAPMAHAQQAVPGAPPTPDALAAGHALPVWERTLYKTLT